MIVARYKVPGLVAESRHVPAGRLEYGPTMLLFGLRSIGIRRPYGTLRCLYAIQAINCLANVFDE
jgi:hypothetical protein